MARNFWPFSEDLLLRIMEIVEASGTGLAFPSQTRLSGPRYGLDKEKTAAVLREVQQWRENRQACPFPTSRLPTFPSSAILCLIRNPIRQ